MPQICRVGDSLTTGHVCTGITIIASSNTNNTVKVNGRSIIVIGAPTIPHSNPPFPLCPSHVAILNRGSSTVRVNGIPVGRITDSADGGAMISGSLNVSAG